LGANLYTYDPLKAKRFFEEVEAGTFWINDPLTDNDAGPFGGFKMSATQLLKDSPVYHTLTAC
jgi:acyl-CoA reductase-like NAD-dependent aldehyde dehydrogenase